MRRWSPSRPICRSASAHKGFAWLEMETRGRAAHGSRPKDGRDAILRMGRVLGRLEALDRDLQSRPPHPVIGDRIAACVDHQRRTGVEQLSGSLPPAGRAPHHRRGGSATARSTRCSRFSTRSPQTIRSSKRQRRLNFSRPPYEVASDHALPVTLAAAAAAQSLDTRDGGNELLDGCRGAGGAGIPSVLFGPGGAGLHSTEEYVNVADVLACRDTLARLAVDWCG